jgi:cytochrome c oxidase subunit 2
MAEPRPLRLLAASVPLLVPACGVRGVDSHEVVTPQGGAVVGLFDLALALSAVVFLLVVGLLAYCLVRFRGHPGVADPEQRHGNRRLEIAWTAAAGLTVAALFVLTLYTMGRVDAAEPGALQVEVIGHQWWWEYRYPGLEVVTANELHLPVGQPAELRLTEADVVHSYWVPQFGWKRDAVPGKWNLLAVRIERAGTFDGACTEYCGTQHAWMRIRVVAQPRAEFAGWVSLQQAAAPPPTSEPARRGAQVFLSNTCQNCHRIQGTPAGGTVGPDLSHLAGRSQIGSGVLDNTPDNLRRWVRDAQEVKPGVLMPPYTALSDDDLAALVDYLGSLK